MFPTSLLILQVPIHTLPTSISLRQLYEIVRVSMSCGVPLSNFSGSLSQCQDDYGRLWEELSSTVSKAKDVLLPEKSSLVAWNKAAEGFEGVGLSGRLKFLEQQDGPVLQMCLQPLKLEASCRFARKFGHDRFCLILLPSLGLDGLPSYLKPNQLAARDAIIKWLVEIEHSFLGRTWRAFFEKAEPTKKGQKGGKNSANDAKYRILLFAENGIDFRHRPIQGETDPRKSTHTHLSIKALIEWFMCPKNNSDQSTLKLFNRLGMG